MLTLVDVGRATIAKAIEATNIVLAIGSGDGAWGSSPPDVPLSATGLVAPLGIVRPTIKGYVVSDSGGSIVLDDGSKWSISVTPTANIYVQYVLGFSEASGSTLAEWALYLDPTFDGTVLVGQNYIPWAHVTSPGSLLGIERIPAEVHLGVQDTIERVISI